MLNKSTKYGILAVLYLAKRDNGDFVPISEISKEINIPFHYLTKIYQALSKGGLVVSQKGLHGGIKIAKAPSSIYLSNIVQAMNTRKQFEFENEIEGNLKLSNFLDTVLNTKTTRLVNEYCEQTTIENLINDIFLIQNQTF